MDTEDIVNSNDVNISSDDSHHTDESNNRTPDSSRTDDVTDNFKMAKAPDNGNIIFDFEGNFIFPSYEKDILDWDSLSKTIGYTTEHDNDGIYIFHNGYTDLQLMRVVLFCWQYLTNSASS